MAYPRELMDQVKDAWLSGRFESTSALARHFKLKIGTVCAWRKRDRWDEAEKRLREQVSQRTCEVYAERAVQMGDTFWKLWSAVVGFVADRIRAAREEDPEKRLPMTLENMDTITKIVERAQRGQSFAVAVDGLPRDDEVTREVIIRYETLAEAIERTQGGGNGNGGGVLVGGEGTVIGGDGG